MNVGRIAGWVAAISGVLLLVLTIASAAVGPGWTIGTGPSSTGAVQVPFGGMMGGFGMGSGVMGPGMMGGVGPGMMGSGHMGFGYGYGSGAQGTAAPIAGAREVVVTAAELRFSPTEITLPSSEVNLALRNEGRALHDLTVPGLGVRIVVGPGETRTVGLRDLPKGRYAGYCSVPGHAEAGMRIAVAVE